MMFVSIDIRSCSWQLNRIWSLWTCIAPNKGTRLWQLLFLFARRAQPGRILWTHQSPPKLEKCPPVVIHCLHTNGQRTRTWRLSVAKASYVNIIYVLKNKPWFYILLSADILVKLTYFCLILIANGPNALNSFMKALESVFILYGESEDQAKRYILF